MTNRKIKIDEDPNGKQLKITAAVSFAALYTKYPKNCPTDAKINKPTNDETAPWLGFVCQISAWRGLLCPCNEPSKLWTYKGNSCLAIMVITLVRLRAPNLEAVAQGAWLVQHRTQSWDWTGATARSSALTHLCRLSHNRLRTGTRPVNLAGCDRPSQEGLKAECAWYRPWGTIRTWWDIRSDPLWLAHPI